MASATLVLELKSKPSRHCYYLVIYGGCHANFSSKPPTSASRAHCAVCPANTLLAESGTHRQLPFWDEIRDSVSLKELIGTYWQAQKAQAASASV
jgi:hypothetical protein